MIILAAFPVRSAPLILGEGEAVMGRFVQARYLRDFDRPILSEGEFFLLPKSALIWQTEKPFFSRMVIDEDGLSQGLKGAEVTRLSFKQFPGFKLLRDTLENSLSGNWTPLEEMAGTKLLPADEKYTLRFSPKTSGLTLPFAYLNFEIGDFLETVEIVKSNGDRDVITFSDQKVAPVADVSAAADAAKEKQP
jgi:outer membrane lipoprotein-sorting protein